MRGRVTALCIATACICTAVAAPSASAALPRAGYWSARVGKTGPSVAMLIRENRREILTTVGRMDVQCPDGHTHTINFGTQNVPIAADGSFSTAHTGPPQAFDHPGFDGWTFKGRFTSDTRAAGTVSLTWTGQGEACHAPADRSTWTGRSRAHPRLTVSPDTVRRGTTLTIRGTGYLPHHHVHIELPNRVHTLGTVTVLQQSLRTVVNAFGRFTVKVHVPAQMKTTGLWRAQAWQFECTNVCWVYSEDFYRVSE